MCLIAGRQAGDGRPVVRLLDALDGSEVALGLFQEAESERSDIVRLTDDGRLIDPRQAPHACVGVDLGDGSSAAPILGSDFFICSQLALAWVLHDPGVTGAIVGSHSVEHVA